MKSNRPTPQNIDDYIAGFPSHIQEILQKIRETIRNAAPEAEETISYKMPTFTLKGYLVYFAAYKKHIGFFPAPSGIEEFKEDLSEYGSGKGTLQFPYDKPIPYDLITRIVQFRVKENMEKAAAKGKKD
jgi:uncharacterized protein YdhG (YjbR/CyaY superfamily)